MGEPDPLALHVLGPGAAEQVEDALEIGRRDPTAVVRDREAHLHAALLRRDRDPSGAIRREIFHCVLDEIAEHLLERQPVGDEFGQRPHIEHGAALLDLVGEARMQAPDERIHVDPLGREHATPLP